MPSAPESSPAPQGPRHSIVQDMYQDIFDRSGSSACRAHKPFPLYQQWYVGIPTGLSCGCCDLTLFGSGHHPDPPWMVCQVILISRLLPTPSLIPPVPSQYDCSDVPPARDLSWLCVHCLLLGPACGPGRHPVSVETSLLTSDWPHYHNHLEVLILTIDGSTPQLPYPPVFSPLTSTLTFSACALIPLVLRIRLWVSQSPHPIASG
jgi:hypothetical protein